MLLVKGAGRLDLYLCLVLTCVTKAWKRFSGSIFLYKHEELNAKFACFHSRFVGTQIL